MDIGFIGLGGMGQAMAANLIRAGHRLKVWNRNPAPAEQLARLGAEAAASAEAACDGETIVSMLADDEAVRSVFIDSGLLARTGARSSGVLHVNMATVSVAFARTCAEAHRAVGLEYVSAPVFGRSDLAAAGKLFIVAAGEPAALERAQPLFDVMGQRTWRLGAEPERANVMKLAGNFLLSTAIEGLAEAFAFGAAHGLDQSAVLDVLTGSLFPAPVFRNYGTAIAQRAFEPAGFRLKLGLKDLRLVLAAGEGAGVPLPLASVVRDNLVDALAHGDGEKDWAAVSQVALRRAHLAR